MVRRVPGRVGWIALAFAGCSDPGARAADAQLADPAVDAAPGPAPAIDRIEVLPALVTVPAGGGQRYVAIADRTDGSIGYLVDGLTWSSSDETVAAIDAYGGARALRAGTAQIEVVYRGDGGLELTAVAVMEVTKPTLVWVDVQPVDASVCPCQKVSYTATALYLDDSVADITGSVTWTTGDPAIATIDATGVATAGDQEEVTTTVTATYLGEDYAVELVVGHCHPWGRLFVTPEDATIEVGATVALAAAYETTCGPWDVTWDATWTSSDPTVATVDSAGLVTGAGVGTATIAAEHVFGADDAKITVVAP